MSASRLVSTTFAGVVLLAGSAGAAEWRVPGDFPTIQGAIDSASVKAGDAIVVEAGSRAGATVTKAVAIRATGHVEIVDGPVVSAFGKAGFFFPGGGQGSGASITGFWFIRVPLPVFSRGADDVTVTRNTMVLFLQGVTNWAYGSWGNRWEIADNTMHNVMTSCGGGIGIMIGDFQGGTLTGNLIAGNRVRGRLRVPDTDCGGYNAPGVLLYADYRGGAAGATIQGNVVTKNRVLVSSASRLLGGGPWLVTVSGIEMSDSRDDWTFQPPAVQSNRITYNDLRSMDVPLSYNPDELATATVNTIENNYTGPGGSFPDRRWGAMAIPYRDPSPIR